MTKRSSPWPKRSENGNWVSLERTTERQMVSKQKKLGFPEASENFEAASLVVSTKPSPRNSGTSMKPSFI